MAAAYVGDRRNRRHKPGRALETVSYRFDVLSDYGAFRDLQRHRMLTIQWQPLTPNHGYVLPPDVVEAGLADRFEEAMARSAALFATLAAPFPAQAPYAVALAYRVRYSIEMNAREAMHMIELRTATAGHAGVPPGVPGDAPPHRRGGGPPGSGRHDALRRPWCLRPGTTRRRAPGRGPPPGPGPPWRATTLNDWFRQKFLAP